MSSGANGSMGISAGVPEARHAFQSNRSLLDVEASDPSSTNSASRSGDGAHMLGGAAPRSARRRFAHRALRRHVCRGCGTLSASGAAARKAEDRRSPISAEATLEFVFREFREM